MKENIKVAVVSILSVIGIVLYLLNLDEGAELFLQALISIDAFLVEYLDLHNFMMDNGMTILCALAIATLLLGLAETLVCLYEELQDEDTMVFKITFLLACIVTFIPFQIYRICRKRIRKLVKKSKRTLYHNRCVRGMR